MKRIKFNKLIKIYFHVTKHCSWKEHVFPKWFCTYIVNCVRPFIFHGAANNRLSILFFFIDGKQYRGAPLFLFSERFWLSTAKIISALNILRFYHGNLRFVFERFGAVWSETDWPSRQLNTFSKSLFFYFLTSWC